MAWLERAIETVAPKRALERAKARALIARTNQVRALYDGASYSRRTQGWRAPITDANAETRFALIRLRSVSRDMVRNNAYATKAKSTISHNVIGTGIVPQVRSAGAARTKAVGALVKAHFESTDIDADGRHNLYGLQDLAMNTIVESGEVLIRRRVRRPTDGYALPFQLQVLEPDYLDTFVDGDLPNGNYAIQGVEFNAIGKRVAYYLFDEHPGAFTLGGNVASGRSQGRRVSADFVAHVYRVDRPGQVRGVTWFAPVALRMRDLADYIDAQLMRQKVAACFAAFVTSEADFSTDGLPVSTTGYPVETLEPGLIQRLRSGEKIEFATPPTTMDFGPYVTSTLREIAAGLGVTYEALTGDLTGVNYSSGRMGWIEYHRNIESWRWAMLIPQMLDPIESWTAEATNVVTGSTEPFRITWTPPRREMINPTEEISSAKEAVRSGLSSRSEEVRKLGFDPAELDEEIAADNERADKLRLAFDSDPRLLTGRGVAQKNADPNAPDATDFGGNSRNN